MRLEVLPKPTRACGRWAPVLMLLVLLRSANARAETGAPHDGVAQARSAYDAGARAFSEKRFAESGRQFEEAARIVPNAVALFTAALAWERAGDPARAADDYGRAGALPGLDDDQMRRVTERLSEMEPAMGVVRVRGPAEALVRIDGEGPDVPVPATLHAGPGSQTLVVTRPADATHTTLSSERRPLSIARGAILDIDVTPRVALGTTPARDASNSAPESKGSTSMGLVAGLVLLGVGTAAEVGNAVLWWGLAQPARDDYVRERSRSNFDRASSLQTWANGLHASAGVLAAAGVACMLWGPGGPWSPHAGSAAALLVGPMAIGLEGSF